MAPREFKTRDVRNVPPIEFTVDGEQFRATGSPSVELLAAVLGVQPSQNTGRRVYSAAILMSAISELTLERIWVADESPEGGHWEQVDDRQRMRNLLASDERQLPLPALGELVMWLISEATDHPTQALNS
jgi:hypothetical protein